MTKQPTWKLLTNLGDVHPVEYGGLFVFEDITGVYDPEMELIEAPEDSIDIDDPKARWTTRRVVLDRCTFINGVLSENEFHQDKPAWFADSLASVARSMDCGDLVSLLCSEQAINRAIAYRAIYDFHGWDNGDSYPNRYTKAEIEARIASFNQ